VTEGVTREARAKVNLFLRVLSRETGGYHSIETLFCRIELADMLVARRVDAPEITIEVRGADTGPSEANLVVRAARAVQQTLRRPFGVEFRLTKRIPVGAGLGGGSADCAAALSAVNELAGNALPRAELLNLAARLGADVPFCLSDAPLAMAWGRGERLLALPGLPSAPILLVSPPVAVSTAEAYQWVDAARESAGPRGAVRLDAPSLGTWSDVARMAGNDFESAVFGRLPAVREAFEALARTRPLLCRMTGSGSTLVGVYRNERDRDDAEAMLGRKHGTLIPSHTAKGT
jgi:4-diphosphocytidyl-2-C-methyl-D-erythritol kinase